MSELDDLAQAAARRPAAPVRRPSPQPILWPWIAGGILVLALIGAAVRNRKPASTPAPAAVDPQRQQRAAEIREGLQKMVASGELYEVDSRERIIRIDPLKWAQLSLETKRACTRSLHNYLELSGAFVTSSEVRSSRSDEVFATCDDNGRVTVNK